MAKLTRLVPPSVLARMKMRLPVDWLGIKMNEMLAVAPLLLQMHMVG